MLSFLTVPLPSGGWDIRDVHVPVSRATRAATPQPSHVLLKYWTYVMKFSILQFENSQFLSREKKSWLLNFTYFLMAYISQRNRIIHVILCLLF